ncbi:MAG: hypothetical protein NVS1B10_00630 [Candidatus Saccharimonadales bacterium]
MSAHSLDSKTIRPGSLAGYSYYHSNRTAPVYKPKSKHRSVLTIPLIIISVIVGLIVLTLLSSDNSPSKISSPSITKPVSKMPTPTKLVPAAVAPTNSPKIVAQPNHCATNSLDQQVFVSINERHLWACHNTSTIYDSAVITGNQNHPDTLTPVGTYYISAKQTGITLKGSDSTGSWNDPVSYWMPFLNNQYGAYGFHDATWRDNSVFGKISPNSADGSHGCVELPLSASKWLFNWVQVGTAVTIQS